jgi:hypothetical protein
VVKYRPDDVLTVLEPNKRLDTVTLKRNQDISYLFEELAAIEHGYSETLATLGTHDLSGVVFGTSPEKNNTVLNVSADIKGDNLDIGDLEEVMYIMWRQGRYKPSVVNKDNELVIAAFTGTCHVCKNQGHTATDCPNKGNAGGGNGSNKGYGKPEGKKKMLMGTCNS